MEDCFSYADISFFPEFEMIASSFFLLFFFQIFKSDLEIPETQEQGAFLPKNQDA